MTKKEVTDLSYKIIGCAIEVHKQLGPGLLESVYEKPQGLLINFYTDNITKSMKPFVNEYFKELNDE